MSGANKITPSSPRIAALLEDVRRGNIKIPVFQREYVWDDAQIVGLLDSIYRGYPVGSLLQWATKERLKHERNVGGFKLPETPEDYPVNYILDGQQRLTTLYGVFNSDAPTGDPELAERFDVAFVLADETFAHSSSVKPEESINLRNILDTTKLLPELQKYSQEDQKKIAALTERFKDYEFPVVTIKDRTNKEVCGVFQRINSSGTRLSTRELLAAWTWSEQFDLRNELAELLARLSDKGYQELDESIVMRCLTAVVLNDIEPDTLVDAPPDELIAGMKTVHKAMDATVDFLDSELGIKNSDFIPFPIMLVHLVRFFTDCPKPDAGKRTKLRRRFWHCAFTQRYKNGTNASVKEDMELMRQLAAGANVLDVHAMVPEDIFHKTWRINSTVAKATICLLAQYTPPKLHVGSAYRLERHPVRVQRTTVPSHLSKGIPCQTEHSVSRRECHCQHMHAKRLRQRRHLRPGAREVFP